MDKRPIGVFDSGLGGLTTLKKLSLLLPGEDMIYLGDTGRVPYGPRSRETIIRYSLQSAAFLTGFDIKAMVIACNTACSAAYETLESLYDIPLYEVIEIPAKIAAALTGNNKVGVIGTKATIRSGAYEVALKKAKPELTVYSAACPLFVPLVEDGMTGEDDVAVIAIAERYLSELRETGVDTLIMGCTHYPLLRGAIAKVMGPDVSLVDSGTETAKLVAADLGAQGALAQRDTDGTIRYYVTDYADDFSRLASRFLESDVQGMVEQVVLEQ